MSNEFSTQFLKKHNSNAARVTRVLTPHGEIFTPAFMPVGTRAAVNCMTPHELSNAGSQIILGGNTYHMLVTPGMDFIEKAGGMHRLMSWKKPMLTDSGGYQVFSLSKNSNICKISDDGASFKHPENGKIIKITPTTSINAQKIIGADIIMAFDECTPESGGREAALKAMERTHRWLDESIEAHTKQTHSAYGFKQALFGIIQGGRFQDLREQCVEKIINSPLDGIAIGGESIGHDMALTEQILDWVCPLLPQEKIRYTMGVGLGPQDLIRAVAKGVDIFDCVAPTRNARHGALYSGRTVRHGNWVTFKSDENPARLLIKKAIYANDDRPIDLHCDCYTCKNFTRSYLHYLFKTKLPLYMPLACIHNTRVMHATCEVMRETILS